MPQTEPTDDPTAGMPGADASAPAGTPPADDNDPMKAMQESMEKDKK